MITTINMITIKIKIMSMSKINKTFIFTLLLMLW